MVSNKPGGPTTLPAPDQLIDQIQKTTPASTTDGPVLQVPEAVPLGNNPQSIPPPPEPIKKQGRPRRTRAQKPGTTDINKGEGAFMGYIWKAYTKTNDKQMNYIYSQYELLKIKWRLCFQI